MQVQPNSIFAKIIPFVGVGIFLVVIVIALILLSYVLLIGGAIGLILFSIAYVKRKLFSSKGKKAVVKTQQLHSQSKTFDNDEFK